MIPYFTKELLPLRYKNNLFPKSRHFFDNAGFSLSIKDPSTSKSDYTDRHARYMSVSLNEINISLLG